METALLSAPLGSSIDDEACCELAQTHLHPGAVVFAITLTQSPSDRLAVFQEYGPRDIALQFEVVTVDNRSLPKESDTVNFEEPTADLTITTVRSGRDLTRLGLTINRRLRKNAGDHPIVICFHSVTALLQFVEPGIAFRFIHTLNGVVASHGGYIHYHIDADAHPPEMMGTFRPLFDTVVDGDELIRNKRDNPSSGDPSEQLPKIDINTSAGTESPVLIIEDPRGSEASKTIVAESSHDTETGPTAIPIESGLEIERTREPPIQDQICRQGRPFPELVTATEKTTAPQVENQTRDEKPEECPETTTLIDAGDSPSSSERELTSSLWQWGPTQSVDLCGKVETPDEDIATDSETAVKKTKADPLHGSSDRSANTGGQTPREIDTAVETAQTIGTSVNSRTFDIGGFSRTLAGILLLVAGMTLVLQGEVLLIGVENLVVSSITGIVPVAVANPLLLLPLSLPLFVSHIGAFICGIATILLFRR